MQQEREIGRSGAVIVGVAAILALATGVFAFNKMRVDASVEGKETGESTSSTPTVENRANAEQEAAILEIKNRRNAQVLAKIYSVAIEMGAPELELAGSVERAVELMREGFYANNTHSKKAFRVPKLTDEQARSAAAFLRWDENVDVKLVLHIPEELAPPKPSPPPPPRNAREAKRLAIARVEAVNMATAAFKESKGLVEAERLWDEAEDAEARYRLLAPFIMFSPASLAAYPPDGFEIRIPDQLRPVRRAELLADGVPTPY